MRIPKWALFALLAFANLMWSGSFSATALAARSFSPPFIVMARMIIGGAVLSPFVLRDVRQGGWTWSKVLRISILGLLGFTVPVTMETEGIHVSSPALGAVSIALEPLLTLAISAIVFRTPLGPRRWFAMLLAAVGAWVVAGCPRPGFAGYLLGDLLMLGAVTCYAIYNAISGRLTADVSAGGATSIMLFVAGLGCVPVYLWTGHPWPHHVAAASLISLVFLAFFATAVAYLIWILVLQDHDVASAAITLYMQPVFGVLISIAVTGERPSALFYLGGAMILLALFLGQHRRATERVPVSEAERTPM
ncbi:DMT family transporter [Alicyclobacillus vulcanalis]|uniref:Permease of the drug/metabolite transporter (DMT) superfamily n=1 Tax=Alicyclobacillus vulcanalis TaxID=252246 RepID=A0A1N7M145_9BACL|nr:DMT family transporter [Alicyclobacillus vulcanalis]SIS79783.1 Permease of the drug/metabolite transporter (DMT) superfamily [Alicyclobacillus vulcanalis]